MPGFSSPGLPGSEGGAFSALTLPRLTLAAVGSTCSRLFFWLSSSFFLSAGETGWVTSMSWCAVSNLIGGRLFVVADGEPVVEFRTWFQAELGQVERLDGLEFGLRRPALEHVLGNELFVSHRDVQRGILDAVIVVAGHHQVDRDIRRDR